MRIGMGYDIHRLIQGRDLVLGGVTIPFEKGLLGHSDADVLVHSMCDAILGAAGLGDIGLHFPDTDSKYKNIYSIELLVKTCKMIGRKGFSIINIDSTVFAELPKLSPFRERIQKNLAKNMEINPNRINVKATTTEGLGIIGKGKGIAAMSIVMINTLKSGEII